MVDTLDVRPATWTFPLTAHAPRKSSIDADLQRFFKECFDDTDFNDYNVEFESFTPEDISGRPVDLINSCRDRPIASDSLMIVIGLPGVLTIDIGLLSPKRHCN